MGGEQYIPPLPLFDCGFLEEIFLSFFGLLLFPPLLILSGFWGSIAEVAETTVVSFFFNGKKRGERVGWGGVLLLSAAAARCSAVIEERIVKTWN